MRLPVKGLADCCGKLLHIPAALVIVSGLLCVPVVSSLAWASPGAAATPPTGFGKGPGFCANAIPGGHDLGANFDDVYACGPANNSGTGYEVPSAGAYKGFFETAPFSYQCTELANRVLFDIWKKMPVYGTALDGQTFARTVHVDYPAVPLVNNGASGKPYLPGDIISFKSVMSNGVPLEPDGHVAIVTASTENSSGDGKVTIMEENAASTGKKTLIVSKWRLLPAAGSWVTPYEFDALASEASPTWAIQPIPNPSSINAILYGVSCISSASCTAVGDYTNDKGVDVTLAEHWNGSIWSIQSSPNRPDAYFSAVSCASAVSCTAVGGYENSADYQLPLAEHWNGSTWSIQTTPYPSLGVRGGEGNSLTGVSCISATNCIAVGQGGIGLTLAEHWNGHTWSLLSTPDPSGKHGSSLSGVSCVSAANCTAVGSYSNSSVRAEVTLAEHWNGIKWSVEATAKPTGGSYITLIGVSCPSAASCIAAGNYRNSSGAQVTLAERWNGSTWSLQSTPNPSKASFLSGVSCVSAANCTAAGYSYNSSGGVTLAEHWNGSTWSIQTTPNPSGGGPESTLNGISCASAINCTAVGSYEDSSYMDLTLAESS